MKPGTVLILGLALGRLAAPLAPDAQQAGKIAHVGILSPAEPVGTIQDLSRGLHKLGWGEGQSLIFEAGTRALLSNSER